MDEWFSCSWRCSKHPNNIHNVWFLPANIRAQRATMSKGSADGWNWSIKKHSTGPVDELCNISCLLSVLLWPYLSRKVIWTAVSPAGCWAAAVLSNGTRTVVTFPKHITEAAWGLNQCPSGSKVSQLAYFQFAPKCPCSIITSSREQSTSVCRGESESAERDCDSHHSFLMVTVTTRLVFLFYFFTTEPVNWVKNILT